MKLNLKRFDFLIKIVLANAIFHELFVLFFGVIVVNNGISFGLKSSGIELLTIIFLSILIFWYWSKKSLGLALIISGGLINLIDRFRFGGVRDYWEVPFLNVFNNINDDIIFLGVVVYLFNVLCKKK